MTMLARLFSESIAASRLPPAKPTVFSGDPLEFVEWKRTFDTLVEGKGLSASERMHYLREYLTGQARKAIEGFFYHDSEGAYYEARKVLEERFGDVFLIKEAYRNKIAKWPRVGSRDVYGLRDFSDFLFATSSAIPHIPGLEILSDCEENRKLLEKLPDWLLTRWNRFVVGKMERTRSYPDFHAFVQFLKEETRVVCNPVCSPYLLKSLDKGGKASLQETKGRSLATDMVEETNISLVKGKSRVREPSQTKVSTQPVRSPQSAQAPEKLDSNPRSPCIFCQDVGHALVSCAKFAQQEMPEKRTFILSNHLCFGCLKKGHFSSDCRGRHTCRTCKGRHPTCLHEEKKKGEKRESGQARPQAISHSVKRLPVTSSIVPVWLSRVEQPDEECLVYALLDTQSDTTFVLDEVSQMLCDGGIPVKLKISTMTSTGTEVNCKRLEGLQIRGMRSETRVCLPTVYTRDYIPVDKSHIPTNHTALQWPHLRHIAREIPPLQACEVGLLIGYDCPRALTPREVISGSESEPFAQRTDLGWSVVGMSNPCLDRQPGVCHRISTREAPVVSPREVINALESDFMENEYVAERKVSQQDILFVKIMSEQVHQREDGHVEMPLPVKSPTMSMPTNRRMAEIRLEHLRRKLKGNAKYAADYRAFMADVLEKGEAEPVTNEGPVGRVNYIPHHGVYHPKRPNKFRVVFDCSARQQGVSLNDCLLKGPELNNPLVGVLCRFRKHPVAFVGDIERMFHQFFVRPEDRDLLRFLWWEDGNIDSRPQEYRMRVHLFGAASSPACAIYGLKYIANKYDAEYPQAAEFIRNDFYVDDGLVSVRTVEDGISLVREAQELCRRGGVHLHKFVSNSQELMASIASSERAAVKDLDLENGHMERTLGVQWSLGSDTLTFSVSPQECPPTRRGILAMVASVYDPLGFVAPFILVGKRILQEMCRRKVGWDDTLPADLQPEWEAWKSSLKELTNIRIPRCFCPNLVGDTVGIELHHFSDASVVGYGTCSYLRFVTEEGVCCSLVFGKARVAPTKVVTIPRLELTAATVAVKISVMLRRELHYEQMVEHFWTDSRVVLGYIQNEGRKFHTFVANRVELIRSQTEVLQWHYVPSEFNPADISSRGQTVEELSRSCWFNGPTFLQGQELRFFEEPVIGIDLGDPEVRVHTLLTTKSEASDPLLTRLERFSSWRSVCRVVARLARRATGVTHSGMSTLEERRKAEVLLVGLLQRQEFKEETTMLSQPPGLPKKNRLANLDPVLVDGVLRVGGRLRKTTSPLCVKHPAILPKGAHITNLILAHYHEQTKHSGKGMTLNELRANGYWVLGGAKTVSSAIFRCVECRRKRRPLEEQCMADLPEERVEPTPPFTHTGMDCFGPIVVKEGRRELKRYGLIFTCKCSRAVHLEAIDDMTTDCFINGLRCFIAIRGPVSTLHSDQGSNFIGAASELAGALKELNPERVKGFLSDQQCTFTFNPPHASHFGGFWERQIRTVRSILTTLLKEAAGRLDTSTLRTLLYEVMAIVNSRPLTTETLNDPTALEPLTPNHILTMKSQVAMPPPGNFVRQDLYIKKRWRKVQFLCEQFWSRWKKEYLSSIQLRSKWHKTRRNLKVGDIVLVSTEEVGRNRWPLGRVVESIASDDGLVRKVRVRMPAVLDKAGTRTGQPTVLERPVQKLTVLVEEE